MKEITESIERLLWFVYRVLFTLFPSVFLLLVVILFLNFSFPDTISALENTFRDLGLEKWLIAFAIVFCLNLILESFTHYFFRILNFRKISHDRYSTDKSLDQLLSHHNLFVLNLLKSNHNKINLDSALFNFGLIQGTGKTSWFNNYAWFLISREFLFSNLAVAFIICHLAFIPFLLVEHYCLSLTWFIVIQVIQFCLIYALIKFTIRLLVINYPPYKETPSENTFEDNPRKNLWLTLIPILLLIASLISLAFQKIEPIFWLLFLNALTFFICPLLFLRALREYIHVEYLILTSYAKDSYDNQFLKKDKE